MFCLKCIGHFSKGCFTKTASTSLFERYQKFDSKLSANKIVTKLLTFTVENYNNESISFFQLSVYFKILFSSGPDLGPDKTISFINFLSYNKIAHWVIRYCICPTSILNWWQCKQQYIMRNCRFNLITQTAEPELS